MTQGVRVHATTVAFSGQGVMITGKSGSGKSSLALQLMALGAELVADDQTELSLRDGHLHARAPDSLHGMIEARGVGLLNATAAEAHVTLVIDLDQTETERLPHRHTAEYLDIALPCLHKVSSPAWPAAILQYLKGGRRDPQ